MFSTSQSIWNYAFQKRAFPGRIMAERRYLLAAVGQFCRARMSDWICAALGLHEDRANPFPDSQLPHASFPKTAGKRTCIFLVLLFRLAFHTYSFLVLSRCLLSLHIPLDMHFPNTWKCSHKTQWGGEPLVNLGPRLIPFPLVSLRCGSNVCLLSSF